MTKQQRQIESQKVNLIELLITGHAQAALANNNVSKAVALTAFSGSGNPMSACAAGLLSVGSSHGPLTETREILQGFTEINEGPVFFLPMIESGKRIPGLGNSFFKDSIDPAFEKVVTAYNEIWSLMGNDKSSPLTAYAYDANVALKEANSDIPALYANASLITAAVCEITNQIPYMENWFFIAGRTRVWIDLLSRH